MELKQHYTYEEVLEIVNSLPEKEKEKLKNDMLTNETKQTHKKGLIGCLEGSLIYMADDFDAPLDDLKEYMY